MSSTSAIGIAGSVSSLGSSRWSRSVASSSTSATEYAPKIRAGTGSGNRSVRAPMTSTPMTTTTGVRQSIAPDAAVLVLGPAGARCGRRRSPRRRRATARTTASRLTESESNTGRSLRADARAARSPDGQAPAAPASASSTSVAWVTPVAPRGAYGYVLRK